MDEPRFLQGNMLQGHKMKEKKIMTFSMLDDYIYENFKEHKDDKKSENNIYWVFAMCQVFF